MSTTIQYKTLSIIDKTLCTTEKFSRAESIYTPNLFDEDVTNFITPAVSLTEIEQTIYEREISSSLKTTNPLYSYVWFLN